LGASLSGVEVKYIFLNINSSKKMVWEYALL
jgi:hypothetical protein